MNILALKEKTKIFLLKVPFLRRLLKNSSLLKPVYNIDDRDEVDEPSERRKMMDNCPILCKRGSFSGWAGRGGWDEVLIDAFYKIEALHLLFYKKYRVRAYVSELKDKFGTIRLDFSVVIDPPEWKIKLSKICDSIYTFMHKHINYDMKEIVDCPRHVKHVEEEIPKSRWLQEKDRPCANAAAIERDGKYYYVADYDEYEHTHTEPTRFHLLRKIQDFIRNYSVISVWKVDPTQKQQVMAKFLKRETEKIVKEVESETESKCECCGQTIGTDWSPRCTTSGWVSYLCDSCAQKHGGTYYKNGDLWQKDTLVKTKAQLEEERKVQHEKMKAKSEAREKEMKLLQEEIEKAKAEEALESEKKRKTEEAK